MLIVFYTTDGKIFDYEFFVFKKSVLKIKK